MRQQLATNLPTINFPGVSKFNREPEEPLQGAKLTVMDILEFTDIKCEIWTDRCKLVPAARIKLIK